MTSPHNEQYPRQLTKREREWLEWLFPVGLPGYEEYRSLVGRMKVIGEGRRGKGEIILGVEGAGVDFNEPLTPVFAYGVLETSAGTISITVREKVNNQISVEVVLSKGEELPAEFEEARRWTYSTWVPGQLCPQCSRSLREVSMRSQDISQRHLVLALCPNDKRMWVYDAQVQVNKLIPITNYYNELMLHKQIRDPKIALDAKRFFRELEAYSDDDLSHAFFTYNSLKSKIHLEEHSEADRKTSRSLKDVLRKIFFTSSS